MKRIRRFWLRNSSGESYGLNGEKKIYSTGWAGLGVALSPSYADLNYGFFVSVNEDDEPQNNITCTLVFTGGSPYANYTQFVNWLAASGTVSLAYDPTGAQTYYRDIKINYLQKGELNSVGWLEVPVSFYCTTPWYLPTPSELLLEASSSDESKRYDYEYTDTLIYGADSSSSLSGIIYGAGHIPGALVVKYFGAITNPRVRLTGEISGKTYGVCRLATTLSESDILMISTRYENSFVRRVSAGGAETDLLDALDLSATPFFHIPVDEPCTVSIEADSAITGRAELTIYYYYRSV